LAQQTYLPVIVFNITEIGFTRCSLRVKHFTISGLLQYVGRFGNAGIRLFLTKKLLKHPAEIMIHVPFYLIGQVFLHQRCRTKWWQASTPCWR
jgi:hypothetical protein